MSELISVHLSNRWARFDCHQDLKRQLKDHFKYRKPGIEFSSYVRMGQWDGYTHLFKNGRVATGAFLDRKGELEKLGWQFRINDNRNPVLYAPFQFDEGTRPYQIEAVQAMVLNSNSGGIVLCATGTGKTHLTGALLKHLQGNACFVVDELTLLDQARRELQTVVGEEVATIGGGADFNPKRLTVASIQTMHKHRNRPAFGRWLDSLDVIIIDELHHALNRRNLDVIATAEPRAVFGLTATLEMHHPWVRLPATALCGPIIYTYDIRQGVEEGFLSQGAIVQLRFHNTKPGVAPGYRYVSDKGVEVIVEAGSPTAEYRYQIVFNAERNVCITELAREGVRRHHKVIVLCERRLHLNLLHKRLEFMKVPHKVLSGAQSKEERIQAIQDMNNGTLPLILSSRIFTKGVDISLLDVVIDATGMPNRNAAIQRYGRGIRKAEGKAGLIYIDIADWKNRFSGAAAARLRALREIGEPERLEWNGNAVEVFNFAVEKLNRKIKSETL